MPKSLLVVFTNPVSQEQEIEYNNWYTEKHIVDIAKLEGCISATRYKLEKSVGLLEGVNPNANAYLALYELEAETVEDLERFADILRSGLQKGTVDLSPSLDPSTIEASFALPIASFRTN